MNRGEPDKVPRSDTGTRHLPGDTRPPLRAGETLLEAVTDAIAWEYRRRMAGGVRAAPAEHAHAFAMVALDTLDRWAAGMTDA